MPVKRKIHGWHWHPKVRSGDQLSLGERAADAMRNSMGSWFFVFGALFFLGAWMATNGKQGFDPYPFILLNLILSCLAALQGAILLIAAKRADHISAELAQHDYDTDVAAKLILDEEKQILTELAATHNELRQEVAEIRAILQERQ